MSLKADDMGVFNRLIIITIIIKKLQPLIFSIYPPYINFYSPHLTFPFRGNGSYFLLQPVGCNSSSNPNSPTTQVVCKQTYPLGGLSSQRGGEYPPQVACAQIVLHGMWVDQAQEGQGEGHSGSIAAIIFSLSKVGVYEF